MDYITAAHKQVEQTMPYLMVIAERTMEGIIVVDLSGAIQFVNSAWAVMHGYENNQQLIGKEISVFHTKEQMKTDVIPFIEEVKRRGQLAGPVDHVRRDGTPLTTHMLMVLFKDDLGKAMGFVGFAVDLSKYKRAKDKLKRYCNRLSELAKQKTNELKTVNVQLQRQIAERKQAEQYIRQQIEELRAVNKHLQEQINKLRVGSRIAETDVCKTTAPFETAVSLSDDEEAVLVHVFKENIALQKPELVNIAVDKSVA